MGTGHFGYRPTSSFREIRLPCVMCWPMFEANSLSDTWPLGFTRRLLSLTIDESISGPLSLLPPLPLFLLYFLIVISAGDEQRQLSGWMLFPPPIRLYVLLNTACGLLQRPVWCLVFLRWRECIKARLKLQTAIPHSSPVRRTVTSVTSHKPQAQRSTVIYISLADECVAVEGRCGSYFTSFRSGFHLLNSFLNQNAKELKYLNLHIGWIN